MAGTNHELVFEITSATSDGSTGGEATPRAAAAPGAGPTAVPERKAGTVTLTIFEQSWTSTLVVTSVSLSQSVSPFSFAITTTELTLPDAGLVLDAQAFAALDAQAVAEEAACEDHSATVRCAYSPTPWCGTDGTYYSSRCMARAACEFDATRGACPHREPPFEPLHREPPFVPLELSPPPSPPQPAACVRDPYRACPFMWAPVCGKDGVTYGNRCAVRRRPPPPAPLPPDARNPLPTSCAPSLAVTCVLTARARARRLAGGRRMPGGGGD